ncbi:MAG: hypothetical protein IPJ33_07965 [Gammaproteobacteria bacterium]|nr:hypothetical protein [Gammaproteobacteria bacterium]
MLLLGKGGGALQGFWGDELWVGTTATQRVQDVHMTVLHILVESVERLLFPENYGEE